MKWNIAAECISVVTLTIIWTYSRRGALVPSLKNRIFQCCILATFVSMVTNILSTLLIAYPHLVPPALNWIITTVYYAATPLMGMAYCFYTTSIVYERRPSIYRAMAWISIPGILYLVMVIINPFARLLFDISPTGAYSQGLLVVATYVIFYFYCIGSLLIVLFHRSWVELSIRYILISFPAIAIVVILIQQMFPSIVLSGSAATCALLIIYLFLQNKQISIDHLTGLPNRQEFLKMLELQLRKKTNTQFTVLVLSLRDFKQINDTFGQASGDAFIKAISSYLRALEVSQYLYRFSGDEFAILLEGGDMELVKKTVQTLRTRLASPWQAKEFSCIIRGAIGLIKYPNSADQVEGLVHGLEYAVARAKQDLNEQVCYCGQEMLSEINRHSQIVDILRDRLEKDSFDLYYQPIISTESNRFVLAESLLRIPDSPLGPIYPSEFIPIAEETGLIVEITYQILRKVCLFLNRLRAEGIELDGVHINFSVVQFTQPDLEFRMEEILRDTGVDCTKLKIEITESVLAENPGVVLEFARRMHARGVLVGLDDFGTGYSNIASVLEMPLDIIKLDKSFLYSAMATERSEKMIRYLVKTFHEIGLSVLVEGVETEEQRRFSIESGVDLIQGFYYSRPIPEEDVVAFLKKAAERTA